ncbi:MAG: low specificity L-threonine aldolase [Clostridia bacterium]|nr:low specificity L-threonine aldolase [Clostridia bacterium]
MVSFESDYVCGAHPEVLARLAETNLEPLPGYGADRYSLAAKEKILDAVGVEGSEVVFLVGGTQTNAVVISTLLRDFEGVVAAKTGHISSHEAGAIEYTGHKVTELPQRDGKVEPDVLRDFLEGFYADRNHEHMPFPGMLYISFPTEYGTLYSLAELKELSGICREFGMRLFIDGARMGYGLMSRSADVTLSDIARLSDAFTIGGTKVGALCGEAVVFAGGRLPEHFLTSVKKRGALLAKGRLVGVQFDALFTDGLYFRIGRKAIDAAEKMKEIFASHGLETNIDSPTNQQFVMLGDDLMERLSKRVAFGFWEKPDDAHTVVRFATSWSTTESDLAELDAALSETIGRDEGTRE